MINGLTFLGFFPSGVSALIRSFALLKTSEFEFALSTKVVFISRTFLDPVNWKTSVLLWLTGVNCAESSPYNNFALITVPTAAIFKAVVTSVSTK